MRKATKRQQDYWEMVLKTHRLGMGRGSTSKLTYAGSSTELGVMESQEKAKDSGRVKPKEQAD